MREYWVFNVVDYPDHKEILAQNKAVLEGRG